MIKACIFDLDGTLTETLDSIAFSVRETLEEMGLSDISTELCQSFIGEGARRLMEKSLNAAGDPGYTRIEEAMAIYNRVFDKNCTYNVTPYEGIEEVLQKMKEQNIKMAVLSNKPHGQTVKVVEKIFGDSLIEFVQGQQDDIPRKPSPEAVHMILDRFGVSKEECLYVGDSEVDIQTGINAELTTIGVTWGFRGRELLVKAGAKNLIDKAEELLKFL